MQAVTSEIAARRIMMLFNKDNYEECISLINTISDAALEAVAPRLTMDVINNAIPDSLKLLEAIYSKLFISNPDNIPVRELRSHHMVIQMVKWLTEWKTSISEEEVGNDLDDHLAVIKSILKILFYVQPELDRILRKKRRALTRCLEGLGNHGLVKTSQAKYMNLTDALKAECNKSISQYKSTLQRLEELSLTATRTPIASSFHKGPAPIGASHQRMMQMNRLEIQERLIRNKSLLNVLESAVANGYVANLLDILQNRVESDKEALISFGELRKEMPELKTDCVVTPIFQKFALGYTRLLDLLAQGSLSPSPMIDSDNDEDDIGPLSLRRYPSTIFASNANVAPSSSKENLSKSGINLSRSKLNAPSDGSDSQNFSPPRSPPVTITNGNAISVPQSLPTNTDDIINRELVTLRNEVDHLRGELGKCRDTIGKLQERDKFLRERLSDHVQKQFEKGCTRFEDLNLGDNRPTQLIRRYGNLYSETRLDAFDALDDLPEITEFDDLKGKLLFSVVVLAFRSVQQTQLQMKAKVRDLLYMNHTESEREAASNDPAARDVEESISVYLRKTTDKYDVMPNIEEVCHQVWGTLYDYPSLKECEGLKYYIEECVRLAWVASVQNPSLTINYDNKIFNADMHTRFHSSDSDCPDIKAVIWPALLEGDNGACVYKGVVVT